MFWLGCLSLAVLYRVVTRFPARLLYRSSLSLIQLEDLPIPLFKAIVYSKSRVRNLVNIISGQISSHQITCI